MEGIKTNYKWVAIAERGQPLFGFVDVFELTGRGHAIVIIKYLAQHSDNQQRVVLTVLLEGKKGDWSDAMLSDIIDDARNRIAVVEVAKFTKFNSLELLEVYYFYIKDLAGFDYVSHSDLPYDE